MPVSQKKHKKTKHRADSAVWERETSSKKRKSHKKHGSRKKDKVVKVPSFSTIISGQTSEDEKDDFGTSHIKNEIEMNIKPDIEFNLHNKIIMSRKNKQALKLSKQGYKVVLIPSENPGVKWIATMGLLVASIVVIGTWGAALYYILTP